MRMRKFCPQPVIDGSRAFRDNGRVKRLIHSDITKIFIFLALTLLGAALLFPWLYNAGKMVAEVAGAHSSTPAMLWFAQRCAEAGAGRYFSASLLVVAALLAGPLVMWLRLEKAHKPRSAGPWRVKLPRSSQAPPAGQPLRRNDRAWLHSATGALLAGSLTLLMMWLLIRTGWVRMDQPALWRAAVTSSVIPALLAAAVIECLFRGALLGVCLRSMRPGAAVAAVAALYAAVHFLTPPEGAPLAEPGSWDAGWRMLSLIGERYTRPWDIALPFLTLLAAGLVLGYARVRTASLWLPAGLHFGWFFVHRVFGEITAMSGARPVSGGAFISPDLQSGILPLSLMVATALLVHVFAQLSEHRRSSGEKNPA